MRSKTPKVLFLFAVVFLMSSCSSQNSTEQHPNVIFIIMDDLNDSVEGFGGHPQALTPNISDFASEGVTFKNAHSNAPLCSPSRSSLWTGIYPHKSGMIGYNQNNYTWRDSPVLKNATTMFEHFAANGYQVYTSGKIFHNNHHTEEMIRDLGGPNAVGARHSFGPYPWDGAAKSQYATGHPTMKAPFGKNAFETAVPLSDVPHVLPKSGKGIPGYKGWREFKEPFHYNGPNDRDLMADEKSARWAISQLNKGQDKPFFMAIGFMRPHSPWVVPQKYFELFADKDIQLPPYLKNDLQDSRPLFSNSNEKEVINTRFERLQKAYSKDKGWKMWIQAYLACVAFVDHQVGKVLNALENSDYADNTIVVLTSDHGFHMGEKDRLKKNTVWEESTRIPLIIKKAGDEPNAGKVSNHPVSLIDLYPTLIDLGNLPEKPNRKTNKQPLDGYSLVPFLDDPNTEKWSGPDVALSAITGTSEVAIGKIPPVEEQHFSVRSKNFRYVRWADGFEELYDHRKDPHEWENVAMSEKYTNIKENLKKKMEKLLEYKF